MFRISLGEEIQDKESTEGRWKNCPEEIGMRQNRSTFGRRYHLKVKPPSKYLSGIGK